jgi:hypothetical protein
MGGLEFKGGAGVIVGINGPVGGGTCKVDLLNGGGGTLVCKAGALGCKIVGAATRGFAFLSNPSTNFLIDTIHDPTVSNLLIIISCSTF